MSDISLIWFAKHYGVNSLGGLAQKAKKHWPPPPPISVRDLLRVLGLPLQPVGSGTEGWLQIQYQGMQSGEVLYSFSWTDPGVGTPIQATSWQWQLFDLSTGSPGTVVASGTVPSPSLASQRLKQARGYGFDVTPVNEFGTGPSAGETEFQADSQGPPPPPLAITATIGSDDRVTVNGQGFNKSQTVNLQATVRGGISTPNTVPNNTQDARNQLPQTTADQNGVFKNLVILPQNFGSVQFQDGTTSHVRAGETIAVIAKNANVSNFTPGPGVSNAVTMTAPATV